MADGNWKPLFIFLILLFVVAFVINMVAGQFINFENVNPAHPSTVYLDSLVGGQSLVQAYSNAEITDANASATTDSGNTTLLNKILAVVFFPITFFTEPHTSYTSSNLNLTIGQRIATSVISSLSPLSYFPTELKTFLHNQVVIFSYLPDFLFYPLIILGALALVWTVTKLVIP